MWPFAHRGASLVSLVGAGIAGGAIYAAVALLFGVLPWSDVRRLLNSLKRPVKVAGLEPVAVVAITETADAIPG